MGESNGKVRGGIYARRNALRDMGWIAVLTKNELQIWEAYDSHASASGVSYPDSDRLAGYIGHKNNNNIPSIRQRLVEYGLLEIIEPGGGRGHPCRVRVLLPEKKAPKRVEKKARKILPVKALETAGERLSEVRAFIGNKGSEKNGERLLISEDKGSENARALNKEEHTIEHTIEHTTREGVEVSSIERGTDQQETELVIGQLWTLNINWVLSGLGEHGSSHEYRIAVARFAVHLQEIGKLGRTSWREKIIWLARLTLARAIAALEHSTRGGYSQLVEPKAGNGSHETPAEFGRRVAAQNKR